MEKTLLLHHLQLTPKSITTGGRDPLLERLLALLRGDAPCNTNDPFYYTIETLRSAYDTPLAVEEGLRSMLKRDEENGGSWRRSLETELGEPVVADHKRT